MVRSERQKKILRRAYKIGYRCYEGKLVCPDNINKRLYWKVNGYPTFSIGHEEVTTHSLVAYHKYGEAMFAKGIEVRHLDGNKLNYKEDNIAIGTHRENMMDIPKKERIHAAIRASTATRKFSDVQIIEIREYYKQIGSYTKTMKKFDISSKGSLHHHLHNDYVTTV